MLTQIGYRLQRLWSEDDATVNCEGHENTDKAFKRLTQCDLRTLQEEGQIARVSEGYDVDYLFVHIVSMDTGRKELKYVIMRSYAGNNEIFQVIRQTLQRLEGVIE